MLAAFKIFPAETRSDISGRYTCCYIYLGLNYRTAELSTSRTTSQLNYGPTELQTSLILTTDKPNFNYRQAKLPTSFTTDKFNYPQA